MIFFTRKLFQGYQDNSGWERRARKEWRRNSEIYQAYLQVISPLLPHSIVRLTADDLHDSVVMRAAQKGRSLTMVLGTANSFSLVRPCPLRLTFTALKRRVDTSGLEGQCWLYDEVHLSSIARFNLQVLFDRSELEVEADDVQIERLKGRRH
jgi:hypothetical protein